MLQVLHLGGDLLPAVDGALRIGVCWPRRWISESTCTASSRSEQV